MAVAPILAVGIIMKIVGVLFVLSCVTLVMVVLIQKGRGGGLSAAFGGGMAGGLLGSKTGDFLTWFTIVLVCVFLLLAVVTAKYYRPTTTDFGVPPSGQTTVPDGSVPAGTTAPAPITGEPETAPVTSPTGDTTPTPVNAPAN